MAASKKPKLSKTPQWGPRSGPQRGILLSLASLRLPFCIFLDIFQQMPMPFWLQYFSRNSNTLNSNTLMEFLNCVANRKYKSTHRKIMLDSGFNYSHIVGCIQVRYLLILPSLTYSSFVSVILRRSFTSLISITTPLVLHNNNQLYSA